MTGRQETNLRLEAKTEGYLQNKILEEYYYSIGSKTARSKEAYVRYVKNFMDYLQEKGKDPEEIETYRTLTLGDLNRWYASTKYYVDSKGESQEAGESIRNTRLYAIKSFFKFLVNSCYIDNNPATKVEPQHSDKQINVVYLEDDEIEAIKTAIKNRQSKYYNDDWRLRDLLIFTLGIRSGLRESALVEINVSDIDFNNSCIVVVEKGNVEKQIFLGDSTMEMIEQWLKVRGKYCPEDCEALFVSQRKRRISTDAIRMLIKQYSEGLDKHITPHKMRSTSAVHLYEQTGDIYLVADMLGHKNIQNTQRYALNTAKRKKNAANILDKL